MVGHAMRAELGVFGQVGRIGGEEFALVSSAGATGKLIAGLWDFRDRIAATPIVVGSASIRVTISIGFASRKNGQTFAELFAEADRALYLAKASGRNRVVSAEDLHGADAGAADRPARAAGDRRYRSAG